ncbi:unnamed protein product [Ectocarpus sp. 6 AP-2014]
MRAKEKEVGWPGSLQPLGTSEGDVYLYHSEAHPSFAPVSAPESASASVPCWRVSRTSAPGDVIRRKRRRDATTEEVRLRIVRFRRCWQRELGGIGVVYRVHEQWAWAPVEGRRRRGRFLRSSHRIDSSFASVRGLDERLVRPDQRGQTGGFFRNRSNVYLHQDLQYGDSWGEYVEC